MEVVTGNSKLSNMKTRNFQKHHGSYHTSNIQALQGIELPPTRDIQGLRCKNGIFRPREITPAANFLLPHKFYLHYFYGNVNLYQDGTRLNSSSPGRTPVQQQWINRH